MGWVLLVIVIGAAVYFYVTGHLKWITLKSIQSHEIILNMWLDGLATMQEKKVYGEETDRIVKMMKHGVEQMAFDLCGYETMVNLDNRERQKPSSVEVTIGEKKKVEPEVIEKRVPEKRIREVFNETN